MAKFAPTKDQQRAIDARGSALLISAAAGSGKTKVLTERLMSYITGEDPKSIDSFLVITFTRAAAGELRSRIMQELSERMAQEPHNASLRRQYALLPRAQISTIHGFCSALIRENCLPLELPPDFKVVDESRTAVMKGAALEKVMEACYDRIETDEKLRSLIDTVGAGRDDGRLGALILNLHGKMQSHAYPEVWAEEQRNALYAEGVTDPGETVWGRYLLDSAAETADYWAHIMEGMLGEMSHPDYDYIAAKYADNFAETAEGLRAFAAAAKLGWERAAEYSDIPFPRLNSPRKPAHPEVLERFKAHRTACKDAVKGFKTDFGQSGEEILADMRKTAPAMEALLELTLEFDKVFAKEKKRRGLVDYGDLEHFAARLLAEPDGSPTALAAQISERYTEIMVDEYQDVSAVQELIFRSVSKYSRNLFTVGDVKQSIYRFRLADPTIFTEKYLTYHDYENAPMGAPRRILLQENFRSRNRVLDAANSVFENIMSTQLGELEYDDNARLRCGASYEGDVPVPTLCLINGDLDAEEDSATLQDVEADFVAQSIRQLVEAGTLVRGEDGMRPARYGDIAILMRSANAVGGVYRRALMNREIPVSYEQGGGFWQRSEVTDLLALLAVTDNPMQDVPLITALRSVYLGFTPDELAQIRGADEKSCYYDALRKAARTMPKAAAFLEKLNGWRSVSADLPMGELVLRIMDDLDMAAVTSAMSDGQMRLRNVTAFTDLAVKFEETGWQGLRRFVVWLQRQMENNLEPEVGCGGGDAVQIMSIHKSKGLEFPIVFLCDTARRFNKMDTMETVLVHPHMGLGPKVVDNERGIEYHSMPRRALTRKLNRETLSEEMRLLYVAMTRPKEYLFVTGVLKDAEKTVEKQRPLITSPVSPQVLEGAGAMVNWLIAAALADGERHLRMEIVNHVILGEPEEDDEAEKERPKADEALVDQIRENLAYRYPNGESVMLPSKLTATELKYLEERDEESAALVKNMGRRFRSFRADGDAQRLNAMEQGIATHLVFQHIDYMAAVDLDSVRMEIARLEAKGILNPRQAAGVDVRQIAGFFASPAGELMRQGERVLREFKFSLLRPAGDYFAAAGDDTVLLQGVIDCAVETDGAWTVIDYKTDGVTAEEVPARGAVYASQVKAYSEAMEAITGLPVKKTILYFLKPGISFEI